MVVDAEGGVRAARLVSEMLERAGWQVGRSGRGRGAPSPGMIARRGGVSYFIWVKSASEGRGDRLVPLWSQAWLQAVHAAGDECRPLAIVAAPRIPARVADQVLQFAAEVAPEAAAGVIDLGGHRAFIGDFLDDLNQEAPPGAAAHALSGAPVNLFSDANQWLLKVLLAPELPESLLSAPRDRYRSASQLARAAGVSVMSASRLVRELRHEGFLHESSEHLELVRREELFRRWQAAAGQRVREVGFRYGLRGEPRKALANAVRDADGCLALFAAADALDLGFVHGVPPYAYVRRLAGGAAPWKNLHPAAPGEAPDLVIRAAPAPSSVFQGAVERDGVRVCDVVQVWLDVSGHPARGAEQADLIRRRILGPVIQGSGG